MKREAIVFAEVTGWVLASEDHATGYAAIPGRLISAAELDGAHSRTAPRTCNYYKRVGFAFRQKVV